MIEHSEKHSEKPEHESSIKIRTTHIIIGLLVVLLLFSVVQAIQINNLKENNDSENTKIGSGGSSKTQASAPRAQAKPAMVGGC